MEKSTFKANGKLLIFGEYVVLRGVKGLAIPLTFDQKLSISQNAGKGLTWRCFELGNCWLEIIFSDKFEILQTNDQDKARLIQKLLVFIKNQRPLLNITGQYLKFDLQFNRDYGMGTSSTLISLLSQWSGLDPYLLLYNSFRSSGYDLAAATAQEPFLYNLSGRVLQYVKIHKAISDNLLFVYSGKKQDSAKEVALFEKIPTTIFQLEGMDRLVDRAAASKSIEDWERTMEESDYILSSILNQKPIQELEFSDYPYKVKSLGAWGGDFIMATCRNKSEAIEYFQNKGKKTIYTYRDIIKRHYE